MKALVYRTRSGQANGHVEGSGAWKNRGWQNASLCAQSLSAGIFLFVLLILLREEVLPLCFGCHQLVPESGYRGCVANASQRQHDD